MPGTDPRSQKTGKSVARSFPTFVAAVSSLGTDHSLPAFHLVFLAISTTAFQASFSPSYFSYNIHLRYIFITAALQIRPIATTRRLVSPPCLTPTINSSYCFLLSSSTLFNFLLILFCLSGYGVSWSLGYPFNYQQHLFLGCRFQQRPSIIFKASPSQSHSKIRSGASSPCPISNIQTSGLSKTQFATAYTQFPTPVSLLSDDNCPILLRRCAWPTPYTAICLCCRCSSAPSWF